MFLLDDISLKLSSCSLKYLNSNDTTLSLINVSEFVVLNECHHIHEIDYVLYFGLDCS